MASCSRGCQITQLGLATTFDLRGETVVNEGEAEVFLQRTLDVRESVMRRGFTPPAKRTGCKLLIAP